MAKIQFLFLLVVFLSQQECIYSMTKSISINSLKSFIHIKSSLILQMTASTDDVSDAEMKKINALLREQGLNMDDMRKLREAVSTGQRYNKREKSSENPPGLVAVDENAKRKRKSFDKLPMEVDEDGNESLNITNDDKPTIKPVIKPIATVAKTEKTSKSIPVSEDDAGYSLDDLVGTPKKASLSDAKLATSDAGPKKRPAIVLKNRSTSTTRNTEDNLSSSRAGSIDKNIRSISATSQTPQIVPNGVTLQMMLVDLIDHHGFEFLYDQTSLKCFSVRPSVTSSLKVLRKEEMLWARKKIEYLYFELKKKT